MKRELTIQSEPVDEARLVAGRQLAPSAGAVVSFLGVVRGLEEGAVIGGLEYEAFRAMAEHQFQLIFDEVERRWPLHSVRLVHRTGPVRVGEASLWVEVVSGHRGEAFAAAQWIIDEMKRTVPIWKRPFGVAQDGGLDQQ